jgi:ectoine hydroxylase-related dioxygenase (phytanoyl-CoA dioxygenase family)
MADILPSLDSIYPVSEAMHEDYQENGYIHLREVCTPGELAPYADAMRDTVDRLKGELPSLEKRDTYGKAFIQIGNLWQQNEAVAKYVLAKRFGQIAADLMGVDGVRLYHDQALFKEAGGGHTPWHQDQYYWPLNGV